MIWEIFLGMSFAPSLCITLQHTATHCNTLQHTATRSNTHRKRHLKEITGIIGWIFLSMLFAPSLCFTLQHTAAHCNTLQHTAALIERGTFRRLRGSLGGSFSACHLRPRSALSSSASLTYLLPNGKRLCIYIQIYVCIYINIYIYIVLGG